MTIDQLVIFIKVQQGLDLPSLPDGNYRRDRAIVSLEKINLIYFHRNNWVLTSKGQGFIDAILKMGELL